MEFSTKYVIAVCSVHIIGTHYIIMYLSPVFIPHQYTFMTVHLARLCHFTKCPSPTAFRRGGADLVGGAHPSGNILNDIHDHPEAQIGQIFMQNLDLI